jgi:hypothetical protein
MIVHHVSDLSNFWPAVPSIIAPIKTIAYLLSYTIIYCVLFGIGCIVILVKWKQKLKKESSLLLNIWLFMILGIIWVIAPVFLYSKFINPHGSFYVERYFFVLIPFVFLITAYAASEIKNLIQCKFTDKRNKKQILYVLIIASVCLIGFQNYREAYLSVTSISEPYREAAEYLSKDARIYEDDVIVICNMGVTWIEYYFNKRGYTIPANVATGKYPLSELLLFISDGKYVEPSILSEDMLLKYKYIYLFEVHGIFSKNVIHTIEENYPVVEEVSGYSPTIRKKSFMREKIKDIFHTRPTTTSETEIPFGLRIYSKE